MLLQSVCLIYVLSRCKLFCSTGEWDGLEGVGYGDKVACDAVDEVWRIR